MFCPGTARLADGRIMITGGSSSEAVTFYNPKSDQWTIGPKMNIKRGYHSMTILDDGSVFTVGGSFSGGRGNKDGEIWDSSTESWKRLHGIQAEQLSTSDAGGVYRADNHMWLFQSPNGRIFHAGPSRQMHWIEIGGSGSITESIVRGNDNDAMNGNAVMYDVGKILTVGGAENYDDGFSTRFKARGIS